MNGIRMRLTPTLSPEGLIRLKIEWVDVVDEIPRKVIHTEEFQISPEREGASYFSQVCFKEGQVNPGTFWTDEKGLRHFILKPEAGKIPLFGSQAETTKSDV